VRIQTQENPPRTQEEAALLVESALATAMLATQCASHSLSNMFLDIPLIAHILNLQGLRQQQIDNRLRRANAQRLRHEFRVGHRIKSVKRMRQTRNCNLLSLVHTSLNKCTLLEQ